MSLFLFSYRANGVYYTFEDEFSSYSRGVGDIILQQFPRDPGDFKSMRSSILSFASRSLSDTTHRAAPACHASRDLGDVEEVGDCFSEDRVFRLLGVVK